MAHEGRDNHIIIYKNEHAFNGVPWTLPALAGST